MARVIDTSRPLSDEEIEYLGSRYPEGYVARMVELGKAGASVQDSVVESGGEGSSDSTADGGADLEDEDLIGFDPNDYTVRDVRRYLEGASDRERQRVIALERKQRSRSGIIYATWS
jgi:hypothetical protein